MALINYEGFNKLRKTSKKKISFLPERKNEKLLPQKIYRENFPR